MKMEHYQLIEITKKKKLTKMNTLKWFGFLFWVLIAQLIFLFPILIIGTGLMWMIK